jgi:hypothetical protein
MQVTTHGGHAARASVDGKFIYDAESQYANPEIWQIPTNSGGPERSVSSQLRPATWASWAVTDRGIVFAGKQTHRPLLALGLPRGLRHPLRATRLAILLGDNFH